MRTSTSPQGIRDLSSFHVKDIVPRHEFLRDTANSTDLRKDKRENGVCLSVRPFRLKEPDARGTCSLTPPVSGSVSPSSVSSGHNLQDLTHHSYTGLHCACLILTDAVQPECPSVIQSRNLLGTSITARAPPRRPEALAP